MAHYVQMGNAQPKVRSGWGVFGLGLVTLGGYTAWWWYRTCEDLAVIERARDGSTRLRPAVEATFAFCAMYVFTIIAFLIAARDLSHSDTVVIVRAVMLIGLGIQVVLARRVWAAGRRIMMQVGMLPEEMPSAGGIWGCTAVLGVMFNSGGFTAVAVAGVLQAAINTAWLRLPRYYPSIGGTREEIMGAMQLLRPGVGALEVVDSSTQQAADPADIIRELSPAAAAGTLDASAAFTYAQAVESIHGDDVAAQWFEYVAHTDHSNAAAVMWVGAYKLRNGDVSGLRYLYEAAHVPAFRVQASILIAGELDRLGRVEEAAGWRRAIA